MKIWWVNQGATYDASREGQYLWAPLKTSRGDEKTYWATMAEVRKNDIVVHCSKSKIVALGRAMSDAYYSEKPVELESDAWSYLMGRRIDVEYFPLIPPIPVSVISLPIQHLRITQGPLNKHGKPKQSYLHRFSPEGLRILKMVSAAQWPSWAKTLPDPLRV